MPASQDGSPPLEDVVEVYDDAEESTAVETLLTTAAGTAAVTVVGAAVVGATLAGNGFVALALVVAVLLFGAAVRAGAVGRR